ncbi:odorant receptor 131-2-like [Lissotriton helveticus]
MTSTSDSTMQDSSPGLRLNSAALLIILFLFLFLAIFLTFAMLMVNVVFSTVRLREQTRYILFVYLLLNDTAYLLASGILFLFATIIYKIPLSTCFVLVAISATSFINSPNSLAAMSLERYVAICYPLRHAEICRVERSWLAIIAISFIGFLPVFIDIIIMFFVGKLSYFSTSMVCRREIFLITPEQSALLSAKHSFTFSIVSLIILYTYIRIMLEAKKISGDRTSSSKACRTVVLDAVQLLLCMTSFTYPMTETLVKDQVVYLRVFNMYMFMLLPRFLSPLIFGFRDETFRTHIRKFCPCFPQRCLGACNI